MEATNLLSRKPITNCHVIKLTTGCYGFVGSVPIELAFVDGATAEQVELAQRFGARFGPRPRSFGSHQEALDLADKLGFEIAG